jgi:hypothetical protein
MIVALISWTLREGLAPVVISAIWFLVTTPLLIGYLTPSQSAEATHRKRKVRRKPLLGKNILKWTAPMTHYLARCVTRISTIWTQVYLTVWDTTQDWVISLQRRHPYRWSGRLTRSHSSSTYYMGASRKRCSRVGRKRNSSRHRWKQLLFLSTLAK